MNNTFSLDHYHRDHRVAIYLLLALVSFALPQSVSAQRPAGVDLDVIFISRDSMYHRYCPQYTDVNHPFSGGRPGLCPGTESEQRWPNQGDTVTFTAHVMNKGTDASPIFTGRWLVDGVAVETETSGALAAGATTTFDYQWTWAHQLDGERLLGEHTIAFEVDHTGAIAETFEDNNRLEDATYAYSLRFYINEDVYDGYETPRLTGHPHSAEYWLQRQVSTMNGLFASYGLSTRVRISEIIQTDHNDPDLLPATHSAEARVDDGRWFFHTDDYRDTSGGYNATVDIDWNLTHELAHQLGLLDLYWYNTIPTLVQAKSSDGEITNIGFRWQENVLMAGGESDNDGPQIDPHTRSALDLTAGYRRGLFGEYQFAVPDQTSIQILDVEGNPVPNVELALFQRNSTLDWKGSIIIDDVPEISGTTDSNGMLELPNRSVGGSITTPTGLTLRDNPFGMLDVVGRTNTFFIRITTNDHEEFAWLHVTDLNTAVGQGETGHYIHQINSHIPNTAAPTAPELFTPRVYGNTAYLCWSNVGRAVEYIVYRVEYPNSTYQNVNSVVDTNCLTTMHQRGAVYVVTAVDNSGLESAFSNPQFAPLMLNPLDLAEDVDGNIIILNPQNGVDLIRMDPLGKYLENFSSEHFHLENARYFANDNADNFAFSYQTNTYDTMDVVVLADADVEPAGSFSHTLAEPTGIDTWGDLSDCETSVFVPILPLLHSQFEGTFTEGEVSAASVSGVEFVTGRFEQGIELNGTDRLSYPITQITPAQGSIEFWLNPNWNGNDSESYVFFEAGESWFNRMRIQKDGANNLRFMVWDADSEYGVGYNVSDWVAGEWHRISATWQGNDLALYIDGNRVAQRSDAGLPAALQGEIHIGSTYGGELVANARMDELLITDQPKIQNSCTQFRYIVADNGNNRIQAFDSEGTFIAESATDFNNPQGVAVAPDGTVWVVDSGNNRLRQYEFDGTQFTHLRNITLSFNNPTGIDIADSGEIAVSDTGNNVVKTFDSDGNALMTLSVPQNASNNPAADTLNDPRGVLYHSNGQVYVADRGNQRVVVIGTAPQGLPIIEEPTEPGVPSPLAVVQRSTSAASPYMPILIVALTMTIATVSLIKRNR